MRATNAVPRHRRKKRIMKRAKGFVGGRGKLLRTAKETTLRADAFAYRDRKQRKRMFRRMWIVRINAAARMNGLSYSQLIAGLGKANIAIDRKSLAAIAVDDPSGFTQLAEKAKAAL